MPIILPGQLQRNRATGKLNRDKATGKIRRAKDVSQGVCCCSGDCPCGNTPAGSLPTTIKATFVGVNIPGGCLYAEEILRSDFIDASSSRFNSFPINATFCLTKHPFLCIWMATGPADVDAWISSDNTGSGVCLCGDYYGADCDLHVNYDQMTIIMTPTWDGTGAVPQIEVYSSMSSGAVNNIGPGHWPFYSYQPGTYLPCSGTVSVDNQSTYYQTYILDYPNMQLISDPGGVCDLNTNVCPTSPGYSFGGHVNFDTTGGACP